MYSFYLYLFCLIEIYYLLVLLIINYLIWKTIKNQNNTQLKTSWNINFFNFKWFKYIAIESVFVMNITYKILKTNNIASVMKYLFMKNKYK